jgi:outer membrane protein OmpA-like peptidoglycan-associated protein
MTRCLPVLLMLLCLTAPAAAQWRDCLAVRPRLGNNLYTGDRGLIRESEWAAYREGFGPGLGIEGEYFLRDVFSVGGFYLAGAFPGVLTPRPGFRTINRQASSQWRHFLGVTGRYYFGARPPLHPYAHLGLFNLFGRINNQTRTGWGLRLGGGTTYPLSPQLSLFAELDYFLVYPDDAIDLAPRPDRSGPSDLLFLTGVGVRYRLATPPRPVQVTRVGGPPLVQPGELATYNASVNVGEATGPLSLTWDFGDGATDRGISVVHQYAQPGTYTVTFTAANQVSTERRTLTTTVARPVQPVEIVALIALPTNPRQGQPVQFTPTLRGTEPFTCRWDLGQEQKAEDCTVTHTFDTPGRYAVTLEAANDGTTVRRTVEVNVLPDRCADLADLHTVYFDAQNSQLSLETRAQLRANFEQLVGCTDFVLYLEGYATPDEPNPTRLATERARAVAEYYVNLGLPSDRIRSEGKGVLYPASGDARWQYRRVLTRLVRP